MQMTESELNEAIVKLCGYSQFCKITGLLCGQKSIEQGVVVLPDYCGNIAAAMELFRELPLVNLYLTTTRTYVATYDERVPSIVVHEPIGKEAQAIARAYYQWKTGQAVEIREDE